MILLVEVLSNDALCMMHASNDQCVKNLYNNGCMQYNLLDFNISCGLYSLNANQTSWFK